MSIVDHIKPHATALRSCAASMEAAGIGTDAKRGHAHLLRAMANHLESEAAAGRVPQVVSDFGYLSAAGEHANDGLTALAAAGNADGGLDIQALARIEARRLVDPALARLMRDLKLEAGAGSHGGMYGVYDIDERFAAAKAKHPQIYGHTSGAEVKVRLLQSGLMTNKA